MTSQVYVWPWRLSWTAVNLFTLRTFNKSHNLLGNSFIHFLICEWNDSYDIMLLTTGVSWRYKSSRYSPQYRFSRKKLHVPPRTVGITADCTVHYTYRTLQSVLITSLCSLSGLSERVSYSGYATGCKIWVLYPSRDMWFISALKCPDRLWDHPASYSKGMGILPCG